MRNSSKRFSTPKTALKIFFLLSLFFFILNIHFVFFSHLYEIKSHNVTESLVYYQDQDENKDSNTNNTSPSYFYYDEYDIVPSFKICYATINSSYFQFLVLVFPWLVFIIFILSQRKQELSNQS